MQPYLSICLPEPIRLSSQAQTGHQELPLSKSIRLPLERTNNGRNTPLKTSPHWPAREEANTAIVPCGDERRTGRVEGIPF
jgi:hypothetical protein